MNPFVDALCYKTKCYCTGQKLCGKRLQIWQRNREIFKDFLEEFYNLEIKNIALNFLRGIIINK